MGSLRLHNGKFAIPFSLEPDEMGGAGGAFGMDGWIVEDGDAEARAAVNQTLDSDVGASTRSVSQQEAEESEWQVFNPDADKDEEQQPFNPEEEDQRPFNPEEERDQHVFNPDEEEENAPITDGNAVNQTRDMSRWPEKPTMTFHPYR